MSKPNHDVQQEVINKKDFFAEIEAAQKENSTNVPESDIAIGYHNGLTMAKAIALKLSQPAAKAAPCGHWRPMKGFNELYTCSACTAQQYIPEDLFAYCPHCGAKMLNG